MDIPQVTEDTKYFKKPDNYCNYNHNVEYVFDFAIHGDVVIDKV